MNFKLPDFDFNKYPQVSVGKRKRWATATAVSFINENKILVSSFLNKKIYLIDISDDVNILNEINTKFFPDLMDYKKISAENGLIVTTERTESEKFGSIGIYEIKENNFFYKKNIDFQEYNQLHGVRFIDKKTIFVTETNKKRGILKVDLSDEKVIFHFNNLDFYPKDVYLTEHRLLVTSSAQRPNQVNVVDNPESWIYLFNTQDMSLIHKLKYIGQSDCLCYENGIGFITLQNNDSLLKFGLENDKLLNLGEIKNDRFNFPHGISMKNGKICVTNYGTNSITLLDL